MTTAYAEKGVAELDRDGRELLERLPISAERREPMIQLLDELVAIAEGESRTMAQPTAHALVLDRAFDALSVPQENRRQVIELFDELVTRAESRVSGDETSR